MKVTLITYIVRYPSASLLFIQLLGIMLYPFMEDMPGGQTVFGAFGVIVLVAALRMVRRSPLLHSIAFALAALILCLAIANEVWPNNMLSILAAALEGAFYFYAAASLIAYMMEDLRASTDELFAVGATFTLLAWAFAYLYTVCQLIWPGSFTAMLNPEEPRTWMELLFLSFTTLSGVGLGDILPIKPLARGLVMLEEFVGVMYITLVVARLISLTVIRR